MEYAYVAPPAPMPGPGACPDCMGRGVTGMLTEVPANSGERILLVDQLCDTCEGCGRADHSACSVTLHRDPADDDDADLWDRLTCAFCRGRRWSRVACFSAETLMQLRMPCGCNKELVIAQRER